MKVKVEAKSEAGKWKTEIKEGGEIKLKKEKLEVKVEMKDKFEDVKAKKKKL